MPKTLFDLVKNAPATQHRWNPNCHKCVRIGYDEEYSVEAMHVVPPTKLMSGRIFIDTKYTYELGNNIYLILASSDGNEKFVDEYKSKVDFGSFSMAYCYITVHYYKPLYDDNKNMIGTSVFFVNETNFGGNVPQWLINKFAPAGLLGTLDGII